MNMSAGNAGKSLSIFSAAQGMCRRIARIAPAGSWTKRCRASVWWCRRLGRCRQVDISTSLRPLAHHVPARAVHTAAI